MSDKEIGQDFDRLNHTPVYKGFAYAFQLLMTGDFSADTFEASIDNNDDIVLFDITKVYVSPDTTITITLSKVNSALLMIGRLNWKLTQDDGTTKSPVTAGYIEVKNL